MPMNFIQLLEAEGIDPAKVRLVRHQSKGLNKRTPWALWMQRDGTLEEYQRIQRREAFKGASHIASFVVMADQRTLFIGAFEVAGKDVAAKGMVCPLTGVDVEGLHYYNLRRSSALREYVGRLVVDWGQGYRSWVQRADRGNKPITELWPEEVDPPFPGFLEFEIRLSELSGLKPSLREALRSVKGIYLLRCVSTGQQYVGAAIGEDGFLGRWNDYAATGHGGNLRMRVRDESDYVATILEIGSSTTTIDEIIERESLWKEKLGSREFGLNAN